MSALTSRGYPYPQLTDGVDVPGDVQALAEAIDTDIAAQLGAWTAYTPTFGAASGSPAVGNGTIAGRYWRIGKTVFWTAKMTWGTTTVNGTSFLRFGLPSTRSTTVDLVGTALLLDFSAGGTAGYAPAICLAGAETNYVQIAYAGGIVAATAPVTFANGDIVRWGGTYEEP